VAHPHADRDGGADGGATATAFVYAKE